MTTKNIKTVLKIINIIQNINFGIILISFVLLLGVCGGLEKGSIANWGQFIKMIIPAVVSIIIPIMTNWFLNQIKTAGKEVIAERAEMHSAIMMIK